MQAGDHNGPPPNGIRSSSFVPRRSRSRSVPSVNAGKNGEFGSVGALSGLSKPLSLVRQSYADRASDRRSILYLLSSEA
jgi:hypothetical protein